MRSTTRLLTIAAALAAAPCAQDVIYRLGGHGLVFVPDVRTVGDYDRDGRADFSTRAPSGNPQDDSLLIVSGRTGTVVAAFAQHAVATADLEGDGDWEAVHSTAFWSAGTVTVSSEAGGIRGVLPPPAGSRSFGMDARVVGDLDGDAVRDLAVTAPGDTPGVVYLYSGRDLAPLGTVTPAWPIYGFGADVEAIADVDGDGVDDLVIGQQGIAGIYSGRTRQHVRDLGERDYRNFYGWSLDVAGDADGDGVHDVVIGAQIDVAGGGYACLCSGRTGKVLHRFDGERSDLFGSAVAGLGDVDGDGRADVAVAAPQRAAWSHPPRGHGYVRVYSGADGRELFTIAGAALGDGFGRGIGRVGDIDGDGADDCAAADMNAGMTVFSARPLSLVADRHFVDAGSGGELRLRLQAGHAHAGSLYLVLGSSSGTAPGFALGSIHVPLNVDAYLGLTAGSANSATFVATLGQLDHEGRAAASIHFPPLRSAVGLLLDHAFVAADAVRGAPTFASRAAPLTWR